MPATRHRELIDLNVTGLTEMLAHFVPPMVARGQGRVLNVASIAAFQPVPMLATYAATKAYVLSLTESLSEELQGTGVTITTLCPGITATWRAQTARLCRRRCRKRGCPGLQSLPERRRDLCAGGGQPGRDVNGKSHAQVAVATDIRCVGALYPQAVTARAGLALRQTTVPQPSVPASASASCKSLRACSSTCLSTTVWLDSSMVSSSRRAW
jgi:NAD(P)-dependent dehydrogenase (short-subunit alcohol dehydrogenase family)